MIPRFMGTDEASTGIIICCWSLWLIISWFVWEFIFKNRLLHSQFIKFEFCFVAFCHHLFLIFNRLWSEYAITKNVISPLIDHTAKKLAQLATFTLIHYLCTFGVRPPDVLDWEAIWPPNMVLKLESAKIVTHNHAWLWCINRERVAIHPSDLSV